MASLQEQYYEVLMRRAGAHQHLTPNMLDRVERVLATPEQVAGYVQMLIDKVDQFEYPSGEIMDRIYRMLTKVATAQ